MNVTIDCSQVHTKEDLHRVFASVLSFPEWYGRNLDALHDVLTDIGIETEIRLSHADELWESRFGQLVLRVFRESAQENDCLTLTEIMTEKGEDE